MQRSGIVCRACLCLPQSGREGCNACDLLSWLPGSLHTAPSRAHPMEMYPTRTLSVKLGLLGKGKKTISSRNQVLATWILRLLLTLSFFPLCFSENAVNKLSCWYLARDPVPPHMVAWGRSGISQFTESVLVSFTISLTQSVTT